MSHHDDDAPPTPGRSPANRLGLDYRAAPPNPLAVPLIDVHTHVHRTASTAAFMEAATTYGVGRIVSMSPLDDVPELNRTYPGRLAYIAIPRWRDMENSGAFRRQWLADLETFRAHGARRMKFWMAPPMRGQFGLTLDAPFFEPIIQQALDLDYEFMIHIGDPSAWFEPGGRYADTARFGTKRDQYPQLEYLLERAAPRTVIAAHMGGMIEEPAFLQTLLDRHTNLFLDSSATKWIVRGVSEQPAAIRDFMIRNQDRVLFGSDIVVAANYDFEHYASRYWAQRTMWETTYDGQSPIEDPDAASPPRLCGVDLPADVLQKLYHDNAVRLGY